MSKNKIFFALGILAATVVFAVAQPAQAQSVPASSRVQITLTATTQLPPIVINTDETEYETQVFKITNKDVLLLLAMHYPEALFRGVLLTLANSGEFEIRNSDGLLLTAISLGHLQLAAVGTPVNHLITNERTGVDAYKQTFTRYRFWLNLATAYAFDLHVMRSGHRTRNPDLAFWAYQYQLGGAAIWMGRNAFIEGRIVTVGRSIPE